MVIRVDVVEAALEARYGGDRSAAAAAARSRSSPGGRQFDDALASELAAEPALTLLCGRYEGFDERVNEHLATDVVSIGPYVLVGRRAGRDGGRDAVIRKLPGALGHEESAVEESFSEALEGAPEYPHYTRPAEWRGHAVPDDPPVRRPRAASASGGASRAANAAQGVASLRRGHARGLAQGAQVPSLPLPVHARRLPGSRFLCL